MLGRASEGCALCFFGIAMQIRKLCAADIAQCLALYDYYIEKHGFFCAGELKNVGLKFGQRHSVKYYQKCLRRSSQAAHAPDTRADCDEKGELCGDFPKESKST